MKRTFLKKVTPTFTKILTTSHRYTEQECMDSHGLLMPQKLGLVKDIQTVVAVGGSCRFVKVGDKVGLTFNRYGRPIQKKDTLKNSVDEYYNAEMVYDINSLVINGETLLFLDEGDIEYVIEDMEEVETAVMDKLGSGIILP